MNRRTAFLTAIPVTLAIAGCGGSHSSSSSTSSSTAAPTPTTSHSSTAATPPASTTSSTAGASTSTSGSGGASAAGGGTTSSSGGVSPAGTTATKPATGSLHVRVPATFTLTAGGGFSPGSVSAPAFLAVLVTVLARDGQPHHVRVSTPVPYRLSVPAGGKASVLVRGQRAGQYPIVVDGRRRGVLMIGGEPGP